eukprot:s3_g16.t1
MVRIGETPRLGAAALRMVLQMPMEHVSLGPLETATSSASPKQKPPWRPVVLLNRQRIDADTNMVSGIEREMSLPELHTVSKSRGLPRGGPVLRRMCRSGQDFDGRVLSPNPQEARILIDEGIPGPVLGRTEPKEEVLSGLVVIRVE